MASKNPSELFQLNDYVSDYESETSSHADARSDISSNETHPQNDKDLTTTVSKPRFPAYGNAKAAWDAEQRRTHNSAVRHQWLSMDAYDRHKKLVNDYLQFYGGSWKDFTQDRSSDRRDIDVIQEHGRFLWSDRDEPTSWSERLAKRYWDKLFKEYCLVDLSRYKENKFGMRWRLEKEVISGKGQFSCGSVHCSATGSTDSCKLRSWEVNFAYKERGERRNALVKLRLCPPCSDKLNYRYKRRDVTGSKVHLDSTTTTTIIEPKPNSIESIASHADQSSSGPCDSTDPTTTKRSRLESAADPETDASSVWRTSQSQSSAAPRSQEEEFDDYFSDMLL